MRSTSSPRAVSMMMGAFTPRLRSSRQTSSPVMPGSITSSVMRSNGCRTAMATAVSPLRARTTSNPSFWRWSSIPRPRCSSSSTTRMRGTSGLRPVRAGRQHEPHARASGRRTVDFDASAVRLHDVSDEVRGRARSRPRPTVRRPAVERLELRPCSSAGMPTPGPRPRCSPAASRERTRASSTRDSSEYFTALSTRFTSACVSADASTRTAAWWDRVPVRCGTRGV